MAVSRTLGRLKTEVLLFIGIFGGVIWAHKPSRYYFFGDSWDVLYLCMVDLRTAFQPHNEHFIPLFKLFFHMQHKLFGGHHLGYMLVLYALHSLAAVLVYSLARRMGLGKYAAFSACLIFAFSSVTWEVTGWEFQQVFAAATVCVLGGMVIFLRVPLKKSSFLELAVVSLLGYWTGGPIAVLLPLCIVFHVVSPLARAEGNSETQIAPILLALGAPLLIYFASLRLALKYFSILPINRISLAVPHIHLRDLPQMMDFSFYGLGWGLILPTLTFTHANVMWSAPLVLIIISVFILISYQGLLSHERHFFWFLSIFMFFNYFVISVGRASVGTNTAIASRYQYLATAPLAILLPLCWTGVWRHSLNRKPAALYGFSSLLLAYLLVFHVKSLKKDNPAAARGLAAQAFLRAARGSSFPPKPSSGIVVLGPDLLASPDMYLPRIKPLWVIFQVLQGNTHAVVPVDKYVNDWSTVAPFSLIRNGDFESPLANQEWMTFGGGSFERAPLAAHDGNFGVHVVLPSRATFARDVIRHCTLRSPARIFTAAIQTRTSTPDSVRLRLIFKNAKGEIVSLSSSFPHPGDGQWHQLVTSGMTTDDTCGMAVDLENEGSLETSVAVDDAVLLLHPAVLDGKGHPEFQPAALLGEIVSVPKSSFKTSGYGEDSGGPE